MKLSKREKILIFILAMVLIAYFAFKFIPKSELFNLDALKDEYNMKSNDYSIMLKTVALKTNFEENISTLTEEINNLNVVSDLSQEKIIIFLNKYFEENKLSVNSINFTDKDITPVFLPEESNKPQVKSTFDSMMDEINNNVENAANLEQNIEVIQEDSQNSAQDVLTIKAITVNIAFESTYENIVAFIDDIQNHHYDILIPNINFSSIGSSEMRSTVVVNPEKVIGVVEENAQATEANELSGSVTLIFYEVPKLENYQEVNQDWLWKDIN